jgi:hypothetical protein
MCTSASWPNPLSATQMPDRRTACACNLPMNPNRPWLARREGIARDPGSGHQASSTLLCGSGRLRTRACALEQQLEQFYRRVVAGQQDMAFLQRWRPAPSCVTACANERCIGSVTVNAAPCPKPTDPACAAAVSVHELPDKLRSMPVPERRDPDWRLCLYMSKTCGGSAGLMALPWNTRIVCQSRFLWNAPSRN